MFNKIGFLHPLVNWFNITVFYFTNTKLMIFNFSSDSAVAIEVRPRSRLFKSSFPVPPAKWTVAIFRIVVLGRFLTNENHPLGIH